MFSFLKEKRTEQTVCLCVVNSYSVTGAVIKVFGNEEGVKKPVVVFSCEEKISAHHTGSGNDFEHYVMMHVKSVFERCRSFHGNFDRIVCTLGEPWVTTFARTAHLEKKDQFKITQKVIDDMVARETKLFEQETLINYGPEQSVGIVGISAPLIAINGYRMPGVVVGAQAKNIDMQLNFSLAHAAIPEQIVGICADVFHRTDVLFQSMDIARKLMIPTDRNATIIQIGGMTTQISVINKGWISHTVSVPQGLFEIEARIQLLFSVPQKLVGSVMNFASDEKLITHERDMYYRRIEASCSSVQEGIHTGIAHIKKYLQIIPGPVVVIGCPAWISIIGTILKIDGDLDIVMPEQAILDDYVIYTHGAEVRNIPLSLAIIQAMQA